MANDMNSVCLVGRLVRKAILSYTNGGTAVSKFSIAVKLSLKLATLPHRRWRG